MNVHLVPDSSLQLCSTTTVEVSQDNVGNGKENNPNEARLQLATFTNGIKA